MRQVSAAAAGAGGVMVAVLVTVDSTDTNIGLRMLSGKHGDSCGAVAVVAVCSDAGA